MYMCVYNIDTHTICVYKYITCKLIITNICSIYICNHRETINPCAPWLRHSGPLILIPCLSGLFPFTVAMYRQLGFPSCFLFDHLTGATFWLFLWNAFSTELGDSWSLAKLAWQPPWASPWGEGWVHLHCSSPLSAAVTPASVSLLFSERCRCFYSCVLSFTRVFKSQAQKELGVSLYTSESAPSCYRLHSLSLSSVSSDYRGACFTGLSKGFWMTSHRSWACVLFHYFVFAQGANWYLHPCVSLPIDAVIKMF